MTEGNVERLDREFLRWILSYRQSKRPGILTMLERCRVAKNVVVLKTRKDIVHFLENVSASASS